MAYLYTLSVNTSKDAKRKIRITKQEGEIIPPSNSFFSKSVGFRMAKPNKWGERETAIVDVQEGKPFMWKVWLEKDNYKKARKLLIDYQIRVLKKEVQEKEKLLKFAKQRLSILEEVQGND